MDPIDREAALNCFHDWIDKHGDVHTVDEIPEYQAIEVLPSVDAVQVVHGRWIPQGQIDSDGNQDYQCSVCGCGENHSLKVTVRYCWNCGARMGEDDNEVV